LKCKWGWDPGTGDVGENGTLGDRRSQLTNNRRERELRRLVVGRKNWLFTWLDIGGERTAAILTILATCLAHDLNPRAYLHRVAKLLVEGWPPAKLRELLPDRLAVTFPDLRMPCEDDDDDVPALGPAP